MSVIAVAKINKLKFQFRHQTLHSPDFASSGYFLFSCLTKWLGGKIFANNEDVEELDDSHYKHAIKVLNIAGYKFLGLYLQN